MDVQESAFLETVNFSKWRLIKNKQFLLIFKENNI